MLQKTTFDNPKLCEVSNAKIQNKTATMKLILEFENAYSQKYDENVQKEIKRLLENNTGGNVTEIKTTNETCKNKTLLNTEIFIKERNEYDTNTNVVVVLDINTESNDNINAQNKLNKSKESRTLLQQKSINNDEKVSKKRNKESNK